MNTYSIKHNTFIFNVLTKYVPNLESQDSRLELEYNRGRNTLKAFFFFFIQAF